MTKTQNSPDPAHAEQGAEVSGPVVTPEDVTPDAVMGRMAEDLAALRHRVIELEALAPAPRAELTPVQVRERSRAYVALRIAVDATEAEEARDRIRSIDGDDAEIGDHVLVLADGRQVRTEYASTTIHDGVPVVSAYESVQ